MNFSDLHQKDLTFPLVKGNFSPHTSNLSLCIHLDRYHHKVYESFCQDNSYPNQLPSHKSTLEQGALNLRDQPNTGPHIKFTMPHFIQYLIDFVVSDDQVNSRL